MAYVSCIKDVPIKIEKDDVDKKSNLQKKDSLRAAKYADALAKFIKHADTPVTIGIQGGWGSGKTSLFSIIQAYLEEDQENAPICVTVNAWEHSLFQEKEGKSLVVLSILASIIEAIQDTVKESPDLDKANKSFIEDKIAPAIKTTFNALGKYMPSLLGVAIGAATGVSATVAKNCDNEQNMPRLAEQIHALRENLEALVSHIQRNGRPIKTVVFIDDLDRVQPATAVEILDVIKNIFDIKNCVFVLAIDYEVVVKGLESKFGAREKNNEREFRQYFDKIIQVPFSMPVGSYSREMGRLLKQAFEFLEIYENYELDDIIDTLATVCKLATGGNPRSIKRLLNTLSLLQYIANETEENLTDLHKTLYLQIRFIIIALHLNFPEISRRLMENNKFTNWRLDELNTTWDLKLKDSEDDLKALANSPELRLYFDEDWEKVIFCLCAQSEWLKRKAWNVSRLMNMLRVTLNRLDGKEHDDELKAEALSDEAMEALSHILDSIAVVSIDTSGDNSKEKFKYDFVSRRMKALHRELATSYLKAEIKMPGGDEYASQDEIDDSIRAYQIESGNTEFPLIKLEYSDDDEYQEIIMTLICANKGYHNGQPQPALKDLQASLGDEPSMSWTLPDDPQDPYFKLKFVWDADKESLEKTDKLAKEISNIYKMARDVVTKMNKA